MRRWLERLLGAPDLPLRGARWVVIDCETTGLDPARDSLLSVGAVAVREGRIDAAESFHALLRQPTGAVPGNVLVHGIGAEAQSAGQLPADALRAFAAFVDEGFPVAFHAPFDAAVLARAMAAVRVPPPASPWLDLARLAPALYPARRLPGGALDDWLRAFEIPPAGRHDALQDAFATAQLLLVLLEQAERQGVHQVRALRALARDGRWTGAR